jgi:hypothetical protein
MAPPPDIAFYSLFPALFVSCPNRLALVARIGTKDLQAACRVTPSGVILEGRIPFRVPERMRV